MSTLAHLPGYGPPPDVHVPPPAHAGQAHEHAKDVAVAAVHAIQAGTLVDRLRELYERAGRLELADKSGRRWIGLTDYEAAGYLGCERSSVNTARAQLVRDGLVGRYRRRLCRYRPSGQQVVAWALVSAIERGSRSRGSSHG